MSYDAYEKEILGFLIEYGGRAIRPDIERQLGIPKASMTNVKDDMVSKGLIKVYPAFQNRTRWEITFEGKKFYQFGKGPLPEYRLPSVVKKYLAKKPKFKSFRPIQETFMRRDLLSSNKNVTVFGPPAAGKTLLAEIMMMREVWRRGKVLYATPYKALDRQKFKDFQTFNKLGYHVVITDGDNPRSQKELKNAPIIIATYERVLGALSAGEEWLKDISLICADEITLLGEERGPTIDSLLTMFLTEIPSSPRIITLSSHVGNKFEIANWLEAEAVIEDIYHDIEELVVYEENGHLVIWSKNGDKKRVKIKDSIVEDLVGQNVKRNETTLVFVRTRWEAQALARLLRRVHKPFTFSAIEENVQKRLTGLEEQTPLVRSLCELLKSGVAFHHAGLPLEMRALVEDLLEERKIRTVVCTTTLSHGIDYPVDNVIVFLSGLRKRWELDAYVCVQLEGRAGRPGKSRADKISGKGRAYLVTEKDDAVECMEKYVFGKPEAIRPDTLSEESLGRLFLLLLGLSIYDAKTIDDIILTAGKTLAAVADASGMANLRKRVLIIVKNLEKHGLLKRENGKLAITDLGHFMNTINISPRDATVVLNSLQNPCPATISFGPRKAAIRKSKRKEFTDFGLLHLASCIDIAKKVREAGSRFSVKLPEITLRIFVDLTTLQRREFVDGILKALVLTDWIEEVSLGEISARYRGYDDHDIYQLGMYASRSLTKIAKIAKRLEMDDITKRVDELAIRCRFGVKDDLARSRIVFLRGIGRVRGRGLLEWRFDLKKLTRSTRELESVLKDPELRRSIIEQSKEMLKNESG